MSWLLDAWGKAKSYGLIALGAVTFVLYNLWQHARSKNTELTRENSDLHAANEAGLKAMQEKEKVDHALRESNKAINNINPKYHYSTDK